MNTDNLLKCSVVGDVIISNGKRIIALDKGQAVPVYRCSSHSTLVRKIKDYKTVFRTISALHWNYHLYTSSGTTDCACILSDDEVEPTSLDPIIESANRARIMNTHIGRGFGYKFQKMYDTVPGIATAYNYAGMANNIVSRVANVVQFSDAYTMADPSNENLVPRLFIKKKKESNTTHKYYDVSQDKVINLELAPFPVLISAYENLLKELGWSSKSIIDYTTVYMHSINNYICSESADGLLYCAYTKSDKEFTNSELRLIENPYEVVEDSPVMTRVLETNDKDPWKQFDAYRDEFLAQWRDSQPIF